MQYNSKRIVGYETSKYFVLFIHKLYSQFYSSQFYKQLPKPVYYTYHSIMW